MQGACCPLVSTQRWLLGGTVYLGSPPFLPGGLGKKGLSLGKSPLSARLPPPSTGSTFSLPGEGMGRVQFLRLLPRPF